jgi:hypothetical protein
MYVLTKSKIILEALEVRFVTLGCRVYMEPLKILNSAWTKLFHHRSLTSRDRLMHVFRENGLSGSSGVYQILAFAIKCVLHVSFTTTAASGAGVGDSGRVKLIKDTEKSRVSMARDNIHKRIYYVECCCQIFGSGICTIIRNHTLKRKEFFPSEFVSNVVIYYHMLSKAQLVNYL